MGIPSDEAVQIRHADTTGDPTVVTVSCPDKIGLGCNLCRVVLFGLNILKGDMSTDGQWCYIVLSVAATQRHGQAMAWDLLRIQFQLCHCRNTMTARNNRRMKRIRLQLQRNEEADIDIKKRTI